MPVPVVASTTSSGAPTLPSVPVKCALAVAFAVAAVRIGAVLRVSGAVRPTDA